ncbi:hypothetical protein C7212DRAFT_343741 [Tuber magnatum]|uniref:Extracellular membrane protein CFEM domain-containing protein n=1 Tax=Tuber magnatum TaxID=42249 RepID=A0A317SRK9_9PEZI|nr:hypothetical protein C7212DRAFT_343741 [Tuber magnatum]
MKLYHHHKSLTSLLLIILLPLLLCLLLSGTPTIAQEACVAWDALTAPVHDCYCLASVKFTGCRPNCTLEGLPSNIVGRIMGVWEFVDPVCKEAVEGLSKAVESKVISTGSPEYTVLLAESFHTALSSSVAATETVTATGTGTPGGGNVNATGSSLVTPPPTRIPARSGRRRRQRGRSDQDDRHLGIPLSFLLPGGRIRILELGAQEAARALASGVPREWAARRPRDRH